MPKQKHAEKVEKYVLSKAYRKLGWAINNALNEFTRMGVSTNQTRLLEDTLKNFYERNNLKVSNPERITLQKYMTKDQVEELADIVSAFAEQPEKLVFAEYEKKVNNIAQVIADAQADETHPGEFRIDDYLHHREQYNYNNYQDYINFIDGMERQRDDALLSEIISSDQLAELETIGRQNGYTIKDMEDKIIEEYNNSGVTHNALYKKILNVINKKK